MKIIPYSQWMSTALSTRQKIAQQFGIAKVRSTSVVNDVVADDGYNVHDVENALKLETLQQFLNEDSTDVQVLFSHLVDTMEGRQIFVELPETVTVDTATEVKKKPIKKVTKKTK